ncbi:potassium channel family protein [Vannielia litorea]|uniref:potassium channel family protein n=1 Tax=Vannielia litorea TaxID=1217970 RepID=UPI001C987615|nr:TrkA family potassium uptake protein [Vannielia litorea]MBY6047735.1 TrkA family potassium uptake protein [Vannielia litorea]MBY6075149.1 TrkA family potassium uptake protein [Vannielia litorea]
MAKENRSFAVIGLGAFGGTVATELARFGNQVIGVDIDELRVARLADELTSTVILDTTDEQGLREAGIDRYDVALVSIGENIEASILTTMNLKMLGVGTIWVKAANRTHHRILSKLGADRVILPEQDMGQRVSQMLNNPVVEDYASLRNGYSVVNIHLPERLDGTQLNALRRIAGEDLRFLGLMRGTAFHSCNDNALTVQADDRLIVLGKRADLRAFGDAL